MSSRPPSLILKTVSPHGPRTAPGNAPKKKTSEHLRSVLPLLKELVRPRRKLLALGFGLMIINRVCGLVLPASTKFLVDNVIGKHQTGLLEPLVLAVLVRHLIQGVTSFTLTQLLSKEAQRLIAELRRKVQEHIGRLPVAYYDANKTGLLVSRIMTDVEGVRNLIGTGLVEFVGGMLTAVFSLVVLLRISPLLTGLALLFIAGFRVRPAQGVQQHPPHFPRARQDQRRGHRPPHRIAGRRARGQGLSCRSARRPRVFCRRRAAPAR